MPTTLPRINVVVSHEQHQLIGALAASSGTTMAGWVRSLIDAQQPILEAIALLERVSAQQTGPALLMKGRRDRSVAPSAGGTGADEEDGLQDDIEAFLARVGAPARTSESAQLAVPALAPSLEGSDDA